VMALLAIFATIRPTALVMRVSDTAERAVR
jgi:hypothetical protein